MKKYLTYALFATVLAHPALCQTLVKNGDFENSTGGIAEGWKYKMTEFLQVAKEDNGNSYLRYVKGNPEYFDAKQTVDLPGSPETIMLRARMRLKGFKRNESQRWKCPMLDLAFIKADGTRQKAKGIHLTSDSGDDWLHMYRMVNVPRGAQQIALILVNDAAGGEVHFDDIKILPDAQNKMLPMEIINTGGTFEVRTEDDTVIYGWRTHRSGRVQLLESGGNSYMSIQGDRNRTTVADTVMLVDPSWKKLRVTCRMKSELLEVGFSPTHTSKLVLEFVDSDEKKVNKWITPIQLKRDTAEWTDMQSEFTVPKGAKGLRIAPTMQRCNGTGHFDDINVELVE